jgi:DNA-binding winged helix-turn-helix (wHTH) protein
MDGEGSDCYQFGPFNLDVSRRILRKGGERLWLQPKDFEALRLLVEAGGRLVEKTELMAALWPNTFVNEENVTQHIYVLRRVLEAPNERGRYIATVHRRGYQLIADVRKTTSGAADDRHAGRSVNQREVKSDHPGQPHASDTSARVTAYLALLEVTKRITRDPTLEKIVHDAIFLSPESQNAVLALVRTLRKTDT